MLPGGRLTADDFLYSEASWEMICDHYRRFCTDPSFVDYFWTVRIMHTPLWKLARVAKDLLPVRVLHSVSTGYAGFLGALLHQTRDGYLWVGTARGLARFDGKRFTTLKCPRRRR